MGERDDTYKEETNWDKLKSLADSYNHMQWENHCKYGTDYNPINPEAIDLLKKAEDDMKWAD